LLALTDHLGQDLIGADGARIGRVRDLAVRLDERHPRVTAVVANVDDRIRRIPWEAVADFEGGQVSLTLDADLEDAPADSPDELWLRRDVLDHQVVDVDGRRLARIGDLELTREHGALRVVAADIGLSAVARRLRLRRLARRLRVEAVPWDDIHLASGRGHQLQLRAPAAAVHRQGPEELMQLVGRLPVARAAEVLEAVPTARAAGAVGGSRRRVAADLLRQLDPPTAAEILAQMPVDDAAPVLRRLDPAERERALNALDADQASAIRSLLAQVEGTAGAVMTPRVKTASPGESLERIRARIAADPPEVEGLLNVIVVDSDRHPLGVIPATVLVSGRGEPVAVPPVRTNTPLDDVIELFATYDVLAVPVVDAGGALVGAVAVDDLLDVTLADRRPGARRYPVMSARRRAPA
jgi:sporulation protein YlmC with PRC-barrel domain